jgi:hypothetical protein
LETDGSDKIIVEAVPNLGYTSTAFAMSYWSECSDKAAVEGTSFLEKLSASGM